MLYLGIDLHRKQMTVSLRNESGDVLLRRQVSTRWPKMEEFRKQLHETVPSDRGPGYEHHHPGLARFSGGLN